MNLNAGYLEQFSSMSATLADLVYMLDDARLRLRPAPAANPVGFIYWHLLRVWDWNLNVVIRGSDPNSDAWHRGGFTASTGYEPRGKGVREAGIGNGFTDAEVDEVPYCAQWLRSYHELVMSDTTTYLREAGDSELQREIPVRRRATPLSPERCLILILRHSSTHIAEIRVARKKIAAA